MKTTSVLMTEGSISKKIIKFAVPIFWGNLFQQLYNVVDSIVVGNYVGKSGLAAVSSTGSLIFLLVGLFGGIFMGAGVVISKYFGADDKESVQTSIHTSIAFGIICSVIISIIGTLCAPFILKLMSTPESVFENAVLYVKIYFSGISSIIMYNTASGIFQAVGDSKRPLYFLIVSSILNVVLDLLFVAVLDFGVSGAAIATIIAQATSAILAFYYLCKTNDIYKVNFKKVKIHPHFLKEILQLGIPSGIQNSVISLANVVIQANINFFGDAAVAGCGACSKVQGFVSIPITSFALAMTTFTSQNLGAKLYDRAKKGTYFGIGASLLLSEIVGIIFYVFAPQLIKLFINEPEVVAFGVTQARTISLFYFLLAFSHCLAGILRGAGKSVVPMIVMFSCWCVIRVLYVTITTYFIPDIRVVFWAYPLTWSLSFVIFLVYYMKSNWIHGLDR